MVSVIHMIVRTAQFLVFLYTFNLTYKIFREKNTVPQRMLLFASICVTMNLYGYLETLSIDGEQSARWAIRLQHTSSLLFLTFTFMLLLAICDIELKRWQKNILRVCNFVFFILLVLDEYTRVVYKTCTIVHGLLANSIHLTLGVAGFVFMLFMTIIGALCLYVGTVYRISAGKEPVITLIAVFATLPIVTFVLCDVGVTGGFDFGPSFQVLCIFTIYKLNHRFHFLDDGRVARERILDEVAEGYIVLDSNRRMKGFNSVAAMLYPELENPDECEVMVELIFLHNHDVLEHNGKICDVVVTELKENNDLTGYVIWLYDCTDEYYCMKELQQLREKAEVSDKTKNMFLHHMTHGFGSPLQIIRNRADAICQDTTVSSDVLEMTHEILEAGQKLDDMVGVLKNYSADDEDVVNYQEAEYSTDELLSNLRKIVDSRKQGRCTNAKLAADAKLPAAWYGDRTSIEAAIQSVLRCSGIVARVTGLEMTITSELRYADALLTVTIDLDDNGITTSEINRIMARMQRGDTNLDADLNYIPYSECRRLLVAMKGTMECRVEKEHSIIRMMFPQKIVDTTNFKIPESVVREDGKTLVEIQTEPHQMIVQPGQKIPVIMVVDDNLLYLKEMDAWLRDLNIKTVLAKNGDECLHILEKKQVDMIFMDQMMPGMDGTQVLQEVRKLEEKTERTATPVVLLTADNTVGARRRYLEAGFTDYLAKPIEPHQIREQVKMHLGIQIK